MVNRRTERAIAEARKDAETATTRIGVLETEGTSKDKIIKQLVVETKLREVATKLEILPSAVTDFIARGMGTFSVTQGDNGLYVPVAMDTDGTAICGKDGKTPLQPEEWAAGLKAAAPHFWAPSGGGGASGSGSGDRSGDEKPDLSTLSPRSKLRIGLLNQTE